MTRFFQRPGKRKLVFIISDFEKSELNCNSVSSNSTFTQFSILSQVTHHKRQEMFREGVVKQGLAVSQAAVNLQGK